MNQLVPITENIGQTHTQKRTAIYSGKGVRSKMRIQISIQPNQKEDRFGDWNRQDYCGTCRFWDREHVVEGKAQCKHPIAVKRQYKTLLSADGLCDNDDIFFFARRWRWFQLEVLRGLWRHRLTNW